MATEDPNIPPANRRGTPSFQFGPYIPIIKSEDKVIIDQQGAAQEFYQSNVSDMRKRLLGEIMPDDSIVEAPSLVTPLLLKKRTIWPQRVCNESNVIPSISIDQDRPSDSTREEVSSDDIQVLKVVPGNCDAPLIVSENHSAKLRRTEQYIKDTVISNLLSRTRPTNDDPTLAIHDFHKTSAADLLISIGLSRVNQYLLEDQVKSIARKMRNGVEGLIPSYDATNNKLIEARNFNRPYELRHTLRCPHCAFHTESRIILNAHLASPHYNSGNKQYSCNWCKFKTKDIRQITSHNNVVHRDICFKVEQPLAVHCCKLCAFESSSKRKFTSHVTRCELCFDHESVQAPEGGMDYPALTSKMIDRNDIKIYDATLKSFRLASYNPHQIQITSPAHGFFKQQILILPKQPKDVAEPKIKDPQLSLYRVADPMADLTESISKGDANPRKNPDIHSNGQEDPRIMRTLSSQACSNDLPRNRPSLLQYPKPQSTFKNGVGVGKNVSSIVMPPTTNERASEPIEIDLTRDDSESPPNRRRSAFINCEICDVYLEDLHLLKKHMQTVHKVNIHHKIQHLKRPPLNCQKCDWRFFTDQGLERHLLGSHSLITTNLQELAEAGLDSGRCSICGMRCPSRLVLHVKEIHKMTLKPATLSYKCTVCSATFSLYRLFENHVYQIHVDAIKAKRAGQK